MVLQGKNVRVFKPPMGMRTARAASARSGNGLFKLLAKPTGSIGPCGCFMTTNLITIKNIGQLVFKTGFPDGIERDAYMQLNRKYWRLSSPAAGLPEGRKNLRMLDGPPRPTWTIKGARASGTGTRAVCLSDDEPIIGTAEAHGAEALFVRSSRVAAASDRAPGTPTR